MFERRWCTRVRIWMIEVKKMGAGVMGWRLVPGRPAAAETEMTGETEGDP